MIQKPIESYALAKLVAILKAHIANGTATDIDELALSLRPDIPGLSHNQIVELVEDALVTLGGGQKGGSRRTH